MEEIPYDYDNGNYGINIENPVKIENEIKNIKDMNDAQKIERIRSQRNQLAHNSKASFPDGEIWVKTCAKLINKLYPDK
ncbi:MAG: hypothetical protein ACYCSB_02065 [bacterium]